MTLLYISVRSQSAGMRRKQAKCVMTESIKSDFVNGNYLPTQLLRKINRENIHCFDHVVNKISKVK